MTKITYVDALTFAIENGDLPAEIVEKLSALRDNQIKRNTNRKPTKVQQENEGYKAQILELFDTDHEARYTVTAIIAAVPALAGFSTPKVSALAHQLVDAGKAIVTKEGKSTVFGYAA